MDRDYLEVNYFFFFWSIIFCKVLKVINIFFQSNQGVKVNSLQFELKAFQNKKYHNAIFGSDVSKTIPNFWWIRKSSINFNFPIIIKLQKI